MMAEVTVLDVKRPLEFDWVEPEEKRAPPNYLLDTEIFYKLRGNSFVQAEPTELHFHITAKEENDTASYKKRLWLINVADRSTRVNFVPPETKWFRLFYSVPKPFVPGSRIACTVIFRPDEARFYEDAIRVHTEDKGNHLLIPLYGYPIAQGLDFPEFIRLPPVPLGQSLTHCIPLKCKAKVDFQYVVKKQKAHPNFEISPTKGFLRNGETSDIQIRFTPTDYTTCRIDLELNVSQINFQPKRCSIIGWCQPGLNAQLRMQQFAEQHGTASTDAALFSLHPLDRARQSKIQRDLRKSTDRLKPVKDKDEKQRSQTEREISCPHHVAQLLYDDYRSAVRENSTYKRRQQKVLEFEALIRQDAIEERRNQVRWHAKLGQQPIATERRAQIRAEWERAWQHHLDQCSDLENMLRKPNLNRIELIQSNKLDETGQQRPHRPANISINVELKPTFRTQRLLTDGWTKRWDLLNRFRHVTAKLIIRHRMMSRLKMIRKVIAAETLKTAHGSSTEDVPIPEDISDIIGHMLPHKPLGLMDREIPRCWTEQSTLITLDANEMQSASDYEPKQTAFDAIEMTTNVVVPPQNWPVFDLSPPWEWKLNGCEAFDPLEARDLAVLISEPASLDVHWVVSFLESRLDLGQREQKSTVLEDQLIYITSTDKRFPIGDPISLNGNILKPAKAGHFTEFPGIAPPMTVLASPQDYPDRVRMYVEDIMQMPDVLKESKQLRDPRIMEKIDDLKSMRTLLERRNTATVLTEWTTSSAIYEPLVPVCPYSALEEEHSRDNGVLFPEVCIVENQLCDYRGGMDGAENSVAQVMEEFIARFPESAATLRPWIPSQNSVLAEKDQFEKIERQMLAKETTEPGYLENHNAKELFEEDPAYSTFKQMASDMQEDIMSLCTGSTSGQPLPG